MRWEGGPGPQDESDREWYGRHVKLGAADKKQKKSGHEWNRERMNQVVMREQEGRGAHQGPGFRTLEPGAKKPGEAWIPDPGSKIQRKPSLPSLSSIPSLLSPPSLPILTSYRPLEDHQEEQEEENHIRWINCFNQRSFVLSLKTKWLSWHRSFCEGDVYHPDI